MRNFNSRRVSMETMKHQFDREFRELIINLFSQFDSNDKQKDLDRKTEAVEALIYDRFHLTIDFNCEIAPFANAYAVPPDVSKNHTLLDQSRRSTSNEKDVRKAFKSMKKEILVGSMNRETGEVSGVYSLLKGKIVLFSPILLSNDFSPEEKAACFLHELGHIHSYLDFLGSMFTVNQIVQSAVQAFANTDNVTLKAEILREAIQAVGGADTDIQVNDNLSNDKDIISTIIVGSALEKPTSLMRTAITDLRNWEALSDQFVSRLGFGSALVSALDKISVGDFSKFGVVTWTIFNVISTISMGIYLPIIIPILLFFDTDGFAVDGSYYDKLPDRYARVRRDLISSLKDKRITPEDTKQCLKDIETIDALMNPLKDRDLWISKILMVLFPRYRKQRDVLTKQKQLEELANNNIYLAAAKLRALEAFDEGHDDASELLAHDFDCGVAAMESIDLRITLTENNQIALENLIERRIALETDVATLIVAGLMALAGIVLTVIQFFDKLSGGGVAKAAFGDIDRVAQEAPKISPDQAESSDSLIEALAPPVVSAAFGSLKYRNLKSVLDELKNVRHILENRQTLKEVDDIDTILTRFDQMSDAEMDELRAELEEQALASSKDFGFIGKAATELGIDPIENDATPIQKMTYCNRIISKAMDGSKWETADISVINKIDYKKILNDSNKIVVEIDRYKSLNKKLEGFVKKLKTASRKLGNISKPDRSTRFLQEYINFNRQIIHTQMLVGKVFYAELKGRQRVLNLVSNIAKENKEDKS